MPRMRAGRDRRHDRHVGAELEREREQVGERQLELPEAAEPAQRRRGIGGAAAETRSYRDALVQRDPDVRRTAGTIREPTRRAQHQIVGLRGEGRGEWPAQLELELVRRGEGQPVGPGGERHDTVELVVAIGSAPDHAQIEIDLGRRLLRELRHGRRAGQPQVRRGSSTLGLGSPSRSFSSMSATVSSSGSRVSARRHW